jgi:sugar lactone lactonase YvrE
MTQMLQMLPRRLSLFSFLIVLCFSQNVYADAYGDARAELIAAYQAQDFETMQSAARKSLLARPNYPRALFNLAYAQVLDGESGGALETLNLLADMAIEFGVAAIDEFAPLRTHSDWPGYQERVEQIIKPVGEATVAFNVVASNYIPEGIAVDGEGRLLLGSIRYGRILRAAKGIELLSDARDAGHWSVFGMRLDGAGGLWFASAGVPQYVLAEDEKPSRSGLFRLNLAANEIDQRAELPAAEDSQVLGDLIIADDDTIYTTDSLTGVLYRYSVSDNEFSVVVDSGVFVSPQGLALDVSGNHLFVADYVGGLYRVRLADGRVERIAPPDSISTYGIDGLYRHGNELVVIQNGIRPHRVVAMALSNDGLSITGSRTLARNLPEFDEPTLGTIVGDSFYFVANSHWNSFDRNNNLPDGLSNPIILKLPL